MQSNPVTRIASRFAKDRSGSYVVLTGVLSAVIMGAVAFGINVVQIYQVKSNLQSALDAAVTSTARDLTTKLVPEKDARDKIAGFLEANAHSNLAGKDKFALDGMVIDHGAHTIEATAHVHVELALPFIYDGEPLIAVRSAAVYSDRKIEVAMMLDTTGSMAKSKRADKIGDLRTAATNAVNIMLDGQDPSNPRVRVAIVPYAEAVNTGSLASSSVFDEIRGGLNLPPALDDILSIVLPKKPDNCATERKLPDGSADFSGDGPDAERRNLLGKIYLALVNRDDRVGVCPSAPVVPLTADKTKLLSTIKAFSANGVTAGAIAAQWGYYMLSPSWSSQIKSVGLGNGADKFDKKKVAKIAILMTDGQFNTAFAGVPDSQRPQMVQGDKARAYAKSICTNMKRDGIEVFTIGFDLDAPDMSKEEKDEAREVLSDCATPDSASIQHFYQAANGTELDAAFKEIILNTERLALTR